MEIFNIIDVLAYIWTFISVTGFAIYKLDDNIETWEDGIKELLTHAVKSLFSSDEQQDDKRQINQTVYLSNEEVLDLVKQFDNHPFDTPSLADFFIAPDGVMQIFISSLGLIPKYVDMTNEDIREMAYKIIQNYYMDTRQCQIPVYIGVATPKRLQIGIPLSQYAQAKVQKQQQNTLAPTITPQTIDTLEEVIEFEDSEEV